ncbi:copper amine oxidase-like protein [Tumebacillus sp. BK434]|uniref:stalk domain-containing protein n=1 Tax=Tumebacillus sp. BK434 TaxID=2512169 RepID=UPI00104A97C5|nr:stalk domain-containing protein [Tumebacillus sp. BK434]TCP57799.1 copper amine oxidase-like protein [Tumebacillus sp. BK434]
MRKLWNKLLAGAVLGLAVLTVGIYSPAYAGTSSQPDVYVDGVKLPFDVQAVNDHGRVLVPLRMIFESIGAEVTWEAKTSTVVGKRDGVTMRLPIGKKTATVGGKTVTLDVPAKLINGRTMVPVRFINESFGNLVKWDPAGVVDITSFNSPRVRVIGSDAKLVEGQVYSVQQEILQKGIVQKVQQMAGYSFNGPVWVYLSNSDAGYKDALIRETGASSTEAAQMASWANGVAYGDTIVLPLHKQESDYGRVRTIAHELSHVLFNQNEVDLPSWVNEGFAWQASLDIAFENGPQVLRGRQDLLARDEVLGALNNGAYRPLINGSYSKLVALGEANYNLELQDYLAMQELKAQYGQDKVQAYLKRFAGTGTADANFRGEFGLSMTEFGDAFRSKLAQELQEQSKGVEVTLNVTSQFQGTFSVLGQNSSQWKLFNLTPGQHTLRIYKDGRLEGATVRDAIGESDPTTNMVFLAMEPDVPVTEGGKRIEYAGAALMDSFGEYAFLNVWKTDSNGNDQFPETNRVLGVEIVNIKAIH